MESILLDNGLFLIKSYGKYEPNILFLASEKDVKYKQDTKWNSRFDGDCSTITGKLRKTKKGAWLFDTTGSDDDLLVRIDWGGSFNRSRGGIRQGFEWLKGLELYTIEKSSNGGGTGYDYWIFRNDGSTEKKPSLEDF